MSNRQTAQVKQLRLLLQVQIATGTVKPKSVQLCTLFKYEW